MGRDFGCYTLGTFLLLGRPEIICVKGNSRQHSLSCLVLVIPQEQGLTLAVCCFLPDFFLVPAEQVASSGGIAFFLVRLVILERGGWGYGGPVCHQSWGRKAGPKRRRDWGRKSCHFCFCFLKSSCSLRLPSSCLMPVLQSSLSLHPPEKQL